MLVWLYQIHLIYIQICMDIFTNETGFGSLAVACQQTARFPYAYVLLAQLTFLIEGH
jgi:hypothetical protein